MNADKKNTLTDSEIQKLREDIAETERRRWLFRLMRTAGAWTVGIAAGLVTLADAAMRAVEWATKK